MNELVGSILFASGIVLSIFLRVPKVSAWWETKTKAFKTYGNLALNVLVGAGILGIACSGVAGLEVPVACSSTGLGDIIIALGLIFGGNQLAYNVVEGRK